MNAEDADRKRTEAEPPVRVGVGRKSGAFPHIEGHSPQKLKSALPVKILWQKKIHSI